MKLKLWKKSFVLSAVTVFCAIAVCACGGKKSDDDSSDDVYDSSDDTWSGSPVSPSGEPKTVDLKDGFIMDVPAGYEYNQDAGGYAVNTYYEPYIWTNDMQFYESEERYNDALRNFGVDKDTAKTVDGIVVNEITDDGFYGNVTQYFPILNADGCYGCKIMVSSSASLGDTQSQAIITAIKSIRAK